MLHKLHITIRGMRAIYCLRNRYLAARNKIENPEPEDVINATLRYCDELGVDPYKFANIIEEAKADREWEAMHNIGIRRKFFW